jgi:anti-sigma factor RsiW
MKPCADVVPLLGALLDGALADDDRKWVEDHLRGCRCCRDRLALIAAQGEAIREVLGKRIAALDLEGFSDRVLARARDQRASSAERAPVWGREIWWSHRRALTAAGGLALAACAALAVVFSPATPKDDVELLADNSPQVEAVDFGTLEGAVLQLPQTTVIWMSDEREVQQ